MNQAVNNPVTRARREVASTDTAMPQKSDIDLPEGGDIERGDVLASAGANALHGGYVETLAFNEEPVTIIIHPSREKNPALVVDCWVNGKGAEVFVAGKWTALGCLPVNKEVTTKRKYVEVLAMSRTDTINTDTGSTFDERPHNRIQRMTSANASFSVVHDANPKGREWLSRVMSQAL